MYLEEKILKDNIYKGEQVGLFSHVIVYRDTFYSPYKFWFVDKGKNLKKVIESMQKMGFTIVETYNYSENIEKQLEENAKNRENNSLEQRAIKFATRMHEGQKRKDGAPYIEHPLRVRDNVKKYKTSKHMDILLAAAVLHDTLEDTNLTFYDLIEFFGPQVAEIVMEVTTDEDLKKEIGKTRYLELRMKNMSSWALVIKLCDRLDNISDLATCDEEFRNRYLKETLKIIEFLITVRETLSKTHLRIIKDILEKLKPLKEIISNELNDEMDKVNTLVLTKKM